MEDSKIIRYLCGILLSTLITIFPLGYLFTSPSQVNFLLEKANFDETVIEIFKELTLKQFEDNHKGVSQDELIKTIDENLINEEDFKNQRIVIVENFYKDLENKKVPIIEFEIINPVALAKSYFNRSTGSFTKELNDFYNKIFNIQQPDKIQDEEKISEENLTIKTSLGINEQNLESYILLYKIFKYGPLILIAISIALISIGYIITIPNTKYAWQLVLLSLKLLATSLFTWVLLPYLFNLLNPNILNSTNSTQNILNALISTILMEIAKLSILIPMVILLITLLIWALILLYNRFKFAELGFGVYEDSDNTDLSDEEDDNEEVDVSNKNISTRRKATQK